MFGCGVFVVAWCVVLCVLRFGLCVLALWLVFCVVCGLCLCLFGCDMWYVVLVWCVLFVVCCLLV